MPLLRAYGLPPWKRPEPALQPTGPWEARGLSGPGSKPTALPGDGLHLLECGPKLHGRSLAWRGAGRSGYTSVSTRSRSILRMLPSTATRLVMLRAKSSGNQPVSPSRSLSP